MEIYYIQHRDIVYRIDILYTSQIYCTQYRYILYRKDIFFTGQIQCIQDIYNVYRTLHRIDILYTGHTYCILYIGEIYGVQEICILDRTDIKYTGHKYCIQDRYMVYRTKKKFCQKIILQSSRIFNLFIQIYCWVICASFLALSLLHSAVQLHRSK